MDFITIHNKKFYRINAMSRAIEEALLRGGIAYQVARGVEFYNRKEIKDVLAYLRVLVNPADDISFLRIINTPTRGIGATTVQRLKAHAEKQGCRLFELLADDVDLGFLGRSASKVAAFAKLMQPLHAVVELPAPKALETVVSQSGLRAMYQQETGLDDAPRANLDELQNAAAQFQAEHPDATLLDWLEHAALISDIDGVSDEATSKVTLMTLHAAKGLEFGVVYIIGLEHGMLPFRRHDESDVDEEEERRLLFVGMTRAKRRLTLSRARYRMLRGVTQRTARSGFLDELPSDEVEWIRTEATQPRGRRNQASGRLPDDIAEWRPGTLVRHPSLGLGQILSLSRGTKRSHAAIQFENGKRESFVIEFADLTRVDFDDIG
ncbi:MAG: ATP-binding domain-containing protein [Planctomycetes bacterium]|nr:ATP-binding domain-containing protein [Planctomycetota bacterium]